MKMLVNVELKSQSPFIAALLGVMSDGYQTKNIGEGLYEIHHFNFDHEITGIKDKYPDLDFVCDANPGNYDSDFDRQLNCYGVCDSPEDFDKRFGGQLRSSERKFVVSFTRVDRNEQPEDGGWRWHKWGPYYGNFEPKHEYIYDETGIDTVYCFQVYEIEE